MNICLIHSVMKRLVAGAMAFATAAAVTFAGVGAASAENGLIGARDGDGSTPAMLASGRNPNAAVFSPGTKVVHASQVRTAADIGSDNISPGSISQAVGVSSGNSPAGQIAQVGFCRSCQQSDCYGTCQPRGAYGYGNRYGKTSSDYANVCGTPCNPYYYVVGEAIYMQRQGSEGFSLTRNQTIDDWEFEVAPRITVGTLPNCVNGYEFTWIGPLEWERGATIGDPGAEIQSVLRADPGDVGFDADWLAPFQDSTLQTQTYDSDYYSGEINKTIVGWDVARVLCGARYIRFDEDYRFTGASANGTGLISNMTENNLLGVQAGLELLYPVAPHIYSDIRGRIGGYYNFAERDARLYNQGELIQRTIRDDEDFAGVFEFGGGLRWQLGEALIIRGGGELWYITGIAAASDQIGPVVNTQLGNRIDLGDDIFFYGVTASAEFRF
jgi:hypothetical protein